MSETVHYKGIIKLEEKGINCKIDINELIDASLIIIKNKYNCIIPKESIVLKKYGSNRFVLRLLKSKIKINKTNKENIESMLNNFTYSELEFHDYIISNLFNFNLIFGEDFGYIKFHEKFLDAKEEYYFINIPFLKYKLI